MLTFIFFLTNFNIWRNMQFHSMNALHIWEKKKIDSLGKHKRKICRSKQICISGKYISQLMRLWYLLRRRPTKAPASLCICAVCQSLRCSHTWTMEVDSPTKNQTAPLDGCACVFEDWIYGWQKVPKLHELAPIMACMGWWKVGLVGRM